MAHQRGTPNSEEVASELCPAGNALSHASWSFHCEVLRAAPEPPEAVWAEDRPLSRKSRLASPGRAPGGSQASLGPVSCLEKGRSNPQLAVSLHACTLPHTHAHSYIHTHVHMHTRPTLHRALASPQLPWLSGEMGLKSPRRCLACGEHPAPGTTLAVCPIIPSFCPCHTRGDSGDLRGRP